ncbi:DUF4344 domain-containing metallopeptidase [Antrihabitans sp. YC2-6]|uniref:DUF4344 domain-containing metallopeptidase n=1 Tax=Antrihabitans sp. YC2-6 TaxID=2799498 RepID=UPI0018F2F920|nr:DUF4344 domain-containing metallopeptidase [Antrihabitans sp. YC2-6]
MSYRLAAGAVAACAAIALAACGSDKADESDAASSSPTAAAQDEETSRAPSSRTSRYEMVASYEDATTPEALAGKQLMEDTQLLEQLAETVNTYLELPRDVDVVGRECGVPNAFWNERDHTISMCYEYTALFVDLFTEDGDRQPAESALNETIATFFHELGHAVISLYDLPATGREEDAADQLSAVILLFERDPELQAIILDDAQAFSILAERQMLGEVVFADEHSLNAQRKFNVLCWIYGSDPNSYDDLVGPDALPEERAERCPAEYDQIERAWYRLMMPHLKEQ